MPYKVLEVVALPVMEKLETPEGTVMVASGESVRKEPGEKITKAEMEKHGQDDTSIAALIAIGAIEEV